MIKRAGKHASNSSCQEMTHPSLHRRRSMMMLCCVPEPKALSGMALPSFNAKLVVWWSRDWPICCGARDVQWSTILKWASCLLAASLDLHAFSSKEVWT